MLTLIFLHGLLGTKADWKKLIDNLPQFRCIALDLPFHGTQKASAVKNFDDTCRYLSDNIKSAVGNAPFFLVGYSLGGRIALYYALQAQYKKDNLQGLILEGVNLGLQNDAERQARRLNDLQWATRFGTEAPQSILNDWYQQPVFAHLTNAQRADLILERADNCGEHIGKMLLATGLAEQPDFRAKVLSTFLPIYYFVGENDQKFRQMALDNQLNLTLIENAGHNAHAENPQKFAEKMTALLNPFSI